ncbi:sulfotransferase domain-containing protein [Tamlana sp. 2_MG-2023]|uniref:sulfotransferase domain-containing protein n=1 Tax=unclassified Tamlana TaxID=2614803 RepID=UPI0026E2A5F6|nr:MULTISPECIES: sulfotransferase domain-containing protein [unclassified Tamlana]MDO6760237.1 sulfotransferase domain-containing protein [Tamlana sp. 2_MG-2023]MDO6790065.1 sulfotransferase domain-containing protein [Tamlana sp. 1_MG-2023]
MGNYINILKSKFNVFLRKKPDFIIIGVQKGGTTSLFNYLSSHPKIKASSKKEIHYFDYNYGKGLSWYLRYFPYKWDAIGKITGESSPYYIYHPLAIKKIKKDFPNVKLIIMFREPLSRAYSQYKMELRKGKEKELSFEEAVKNFNEINLEHEKLKNKSVLYSYSHQNFSYLNRGQYADQLKEVYKHFTEDKVLLLKSETFFSKTKESLEEVYHFLGINPFFDFPIEIHNKGNYDLKPDILPQKYNSFFTKSNSDLSKMTNGKISW